MSFEKPMKPDSIEMIECRRSDAPTLWVRMSHASASVSRGVTLHCCALESEYSDFIAVTNATGDQFMPCTGGSLGREAVDDQPIAPEVILAGHEVVRSRTVAHAWKPGTILRVDSRRSP
jgi:hypothetical protein